MPKFLFAIGLPIVMFYTYSCSEKNQPTKLLPDFKSFEISYVYGGEKHFSFLVDTNKIYFSPIGFESAKYGFFPDSLFKLIDSCFLTIHHDSTIKSNDDGCKDCDVVAIRVITNYDTIIINQTNHINKNVLCIAKAIQTFLDSGKHESFNIPICKDTRALVSRFPFPVMEEPKFKMQKQIK